MLSVIHMLSDMSDTEDTKTNKEQFSDSQISQQAGATAESQNIMATASATLPPGLKPPQPLKKNRKLAANWKRFKRNWDNSSIVARLDQFEEGFKTAMFLLVVGEDGLEIYDGMDFSPETDCEMLKKVVKKFEEFCIGETNETYERFIFNRRNQEENESVDQYVTALRKLPHTCNFCSCLHDSLIRDRLVLGIRDESIRKKLLQEKKLNLSHAIDIGRRGQDYQYSSPGDQETIDTRIRRN